jgi:hypothetical protein
MWQWTSRLTDEGSRIQRTLYRPPSAQTLPQFFHRWPLSDCLNFLQQIV